MTFQETNDAGFFGMIHELLEKQMPSDQERRSEDRHPYQCVQLLAPYDREALPQASDFHSVFCNDLSSKGFSFYLSQRPCYKYVIVALGKVPFSFFSAEVVRCEKVKVSKEVEFLIGCRFIGRLTESETNKSLAEE